MLAIPWFFAQRNDMGIFGLAYIAAAALAFFWSPYSGILIDRYDRKQVLMVVDGIGAAILLLLGTYGYIQGGLPSLGVAFIFVVTFLIFNIHYPNLYAFIQEITPPERYGRVTSLLETIHQSTSVLSGAVAALLLEGTTDGRINIFGLEITTSLRIDPWPIHEIFLLDGSTYLVGLVLVSWIRYTSLKTRPKEVGRLGERLRIGFQYLRDHPRIFWFGMASYAVFTTVLVINFYQGPTYVSKHLSASAAVFASGKMYFALGAILAAVTIRYVFQNVSLKQSIILITIVAAIWYFLLGVTNDVWIYYTYALFLGICNSGSRIQRVNWLFARVPNNVYGRTGSILFIINTAIRIAFVGLFALPFFQQAAMVPITFLILAVYLLGAVVVLFYKV